MNNRSKQLKRIQDEAFTLFMKKNADYGDAFATYGPVGVLVRLGDKISRLTSITTSGVNLVNTETLRDTLIDLHNYSAMAVMLMDEDEGVKRIQNPRIKALRSQSSHSPTSSDATRLHRKKFISAFD